MTKNPIPQELVPWIEAKKKCRLSQKHVQMARELGMNPKGLSKLNNHQDNPWKAPLQEYLEELYFKRFQKEEPDVVLSFLEIAAQIRKKKASKEQGLQEE